VFRCWLGGSGRLGWSDLVGGSDRLGASERAGGCGGAGGTERVGGSGLVVPEPGRFTGSERLDPGLGGDVLLPASVRGLGRCDGPVRPVSPSGRCRERSVVERSVGACPGVPGLTRVKLRPGPVWSVRSRLVVGWVDESRSTRSRPLPSGLSRVASRLSVLRVSTVRLGRVRDTKSTVRLGARISRSPGILVRPSASRRRTAPRSGGWRSPTSRRMTSPTPRSASSRPGVRVTSGPERTMPSLRLPISRSTRSVSTRTRSMWGLPKRSPGTNVQGRGSTSRIRTRPEKSNAACDQRSGQRPRYC